MGGWALAQIAITFFFQCGMFAIVFQDLIGFVLLLSFQKFFVSKLKFQYVFDDLFFSSLLFFPSPLSLPCHLCFEDKQVFNIEENELK